MNPNFSEELKKTYTLVLFIYFTFVCAVFGYGVLAYVIVQRKVETSPAPVFKSLIYAIALLTLLFSPFIKQLILSKKLNLGSVQLRPNIPEVLVRLQTSSIIAMAMCESCAVYGLILIFTGASLIDFGILAFLSLVGFVLHFPKFQEWERWIENQPESTQ